MHDSSERLQVLYELSRRLASFGRVVSTDSARGVHLGVKQGRQPGLKLGYSQVANPLYLIGKGTMSPRRALTMVARSLLLMIGAPVRTQRVKSPLAKLVKKLLL